MDDPGQNQKFLPDPILCQNRFPRQTEAAAARGLSKSLFRIMITVSDHCMSTERCPLCTSLSFTHSVTFVIIFFGLKLNKHYKIHFRKNNIVFLASGIYFTFTLNVAFWYYIFVVVSYLDFFSILNRSIRLFVCLIFITLV